MSFHPEVPMRITWTTSGPFRRAAPGKSSGTRFGAVSDRTVVRRWATPTPKSVLTTTGIQRSEEISKTNTSAGFLDEESGFLFLGEQIPDALIVLRFC